MHESKKNSHIYPDKANFPVISIAIYSFVYRQKVRLINKHVEDAAAVNNFRRNLFIAVQCVCTQETHGSSTQHAKKK